jgi:hypothetical protein
MLELSITEYDGLAERTEMTLSEIDAMLENLPHVVILRGGETGYTGSERDALRFARQNENALHVLPYIDVDVVPIFTRYFAPRRFDWKTGLYFEQCEACLRDQRKVTILSVPATAKTLRKQLCSDCAQSCPTCGQVNAETFEVEDSDFETGYSAIETRCGHCEGWAL